MYFPYLRGKQFELIALREIAPLISKGQHIKPIISPVKKKTTTYVKTLEILQERNINFTIVLNPRVGDVADNMDYIASNLLPDVGYHNFQIGIIIRHNTNFEVLIADLERLNLDAHPITLLIGALSDEALDELSAFILNYNVVYVLTGPNVTKRRKALREIRKVADNTISLTDAFSKQDRNKDYAKETDEFFSDEHIYYSDGGFVGYSDFLTVGTHYSDKGYSPYAVAIHLTYFNSDDELRIHHFVSDSNDDTSDVGGKFEEALDKLIPFIDEQALNTMASNTYRRLNDEGKYPGLGTVKKLSILHHIELVHNYFSK